MSHAEEKGFRLQVSISKTCCLDPSEARFFRETL